MNTMTIQLRKIQNGYILSATKADPTGMRNYGPGYDARGRLLTATEVYCKDKKEVAAATQKLLGD